MKPILCIYYITYRCNARCSFCNIWYDPEFENVSDCSVENVEINLRQVRKTGVKFVDFTGGEPLLHPDLPAFLEIARRLGLYTSVTTNCKRYPDLAEALRGRVDLLHFSLDSFVGEEHDYLRGQNLFTNVMHSIEIAQGIGERPDLLFTATHKNFDAIGELSEFAREKKLMLIVNPVFNYCGQERLNNAALNYLESYSRKPYVYVNHALHKLIRKRGNDRLRPRCRAMSSSILITPDNQLLTPCFHHSKEKIPIKMNLREIITGSSYKREKELQGRHSFCEGCTINCYFDPSFLYKIDEYLLLSLFSKAKYGFDKYVRY